MSKPERTSVPARRAAFKASFEVFSTKESDFLLSHGWDVTLKCEHGFWSESVFKTGMVQAPVSGAEAYRLEKASIMRRLADEARERWRSNILAYQEALRAKGIIIDPQLGPEGQQGPQAIAASQAAKTTATWISFLERNEIPLREEDQARKQARARKVERRRA